MAKSGAVVLLAPACASFDQFSSYADRGLKFQDAARLTAADGALEFVNTDRKNVQSTAGE
ncbi:hypothetical protein RQN30_02575 [Arcanobacterium hippocoleae]